MGPYNGQIANIRAGLMGTEMPSTYGGVPGPGYAPTPMMQDHTQLHAPDMSGPNLQLHRGAGAMADMFELARKNPTAVPQHYSSLADDMQNANSGTNSGGNGFGGGGYRGM